MTASELAVWLLDYPTAKLRVISFDMKDGAVYQVRWNQRNNEIWILAT